MRPSASSAATVPTFRGAVAADDLGPTLIHEHIFVTDPVLDRDMPHPEWDEDEAVAKAVAGLRDVHDLGVRTVVDLTVPGLGRDVARVQRVAAEAPVALIAATGWYADTALPPFFRLNGPGRVVDGPDPLEALFLRDIREGIQGTDVRAGMIKIVSDAAGFTPDVQDVFRAAAAAQRETGVPITTHSHAPTRGGLEQQRMLTHLGVPLDRVVIGHSGDSDDIDYLRRIADAGSYLGFDRFGMAHMAPDEQRIAMLMELLDEGYEERIVLSHDAAFFSRVTPPSWRATAAPDWHMERIHTGILPRLRAAGIGGGTIDMMMVTNPRRILAGGE